MEHKSEYLYGMTGKDILDIVKLIQEGYNSEKDKNNGLDNKLEALKDYKDAYQDALQEFANDNLPNNDVEKINELYRDYQENNEGKDFLNYVIDKNGDREFLQTMQEEIHRGSTVEEAKNLAIEECQTK